MLVRVYCFIGFLGLNICCLAAEENSWERHLEAARKLHAQASYKDAEKEYLAALQDAEALGPAAAEIFCYVYDVSDAGNFEHANILNLPKTIEQCARPVHAVALI